MQAVMTPARGATAWLVTTLILAACGPADETPRGCGLEGTAALPDYGAELAFDCNVKPSSRFHGDILVMRPGEPARALTHGEGFNYRPRWSPNGDRIAFGSTRTGSQQLYVMNDDGTDVIQLTHDRAYVGDVDWSPDGTQIVYASSAAGLTGPLGVIHFPSDIYVARADGSGARRLTFQGGFNGQPAWSPDGGKILFVSDRDGPYQVWVMAADGRGQHPLTSAGQNGSPAWSPDGAGIVFHSERNYPGGYRATVYVMSADGSDQRRLIDGEGGSPAWSRNGRWIAFVSRTGGGLDVFAVHADGSGLTRLTRDGSTKLDLAWGPS
jgi:Tol biopolymer transport system component